MQTVVIVIHLMVPLREFESLVKRLMAFDALAKQAVR